MTKKEFADSWKHFCNCIDFGKSNLDAEAIRFMNEGIGKVAQTFQQRDDLLAACKRLMEAWNSPNTRRSMYQLKTDMDLAYDNAKAAIKKAKD